MTMIQEVEDSLEGFIKKVISDKIWLYTKIISDLLIL